MVNLNAANESVRGK